ncbi:MAG: hypothetical protein JNL60_10150 [Bacteroidia bacterium]|nr:hypothetical protein [Bacteroidia bacterium]
MAEIAILKSTFDLKLAGEYRVALSAEEKIFIAFAGIIKKHHGPAMRAFGSFTKQ